MVINITRAFILFIILTPLCYGSAWFYCFQDKAKCSASQCAIASCYADKNTITDIKKNPSHSSHIGPGTLERIQAVCVNTKDGKQTGYGVVKGVQGGSDNKHVTCTSWVELITANKGVIHWHDCQSWTPYSHNVVVDRIDCTFF